MRLDQLRTGIGGNRGPLLDPSPRGAPLSPRVFDGGAWIDAYRTINNMPDHFHLIITPEERIPLEKALQYIKGGFSFRAKRELGYRYLIWEEGFTNHRIRDEQDYENHRDYIHQNPVRAGFVDRAEDYYWSSIRLWNKCPRDDEPLRVDIDKIVWRRS